MDNRTNDNLICIKYGYKPANSHSWGPGVRDIYALHYIISGKGYFESNHTTYSLKAGESFLIYPQVEVFYYPDPDDPWEYIWVDFTGNDILELLHKTKLSQQSPVTPEIQENLEPLFRIEESTGIMPHEKERAKAKLHLLLSYYIEYYPLTRIDCKTNYVILAKEYIENNYWRESLTVAEVVDYVKIERTYLFRLFKTATGRSISNYLTNYRINRACILLKSSRLSIKAVACSVGYMDQLYFSKLFKRITSYTPSEYRHILDET